MKLIKRQKVRILNFGGYFPPKPIEGVLFTYEGNYQIFHGCGFDFVITESIVYELMID